MLDPLFRSTEKAGTETFSTFQLSSKINLGHFKNRDAFQPSFKQEFLTHYQQSNQSHSQEFEKSGLSTTKFGIGFQRKPSTQIENKVSEIEKQYAQTKVEKIQRQSQERSNFLRSVDQKTGFNLITGQPIGNGPIERPQGIKMVGDGLGSEAPTRGHNILKQSEGRFFVPHPSGIRHDLRQDQLVREGISHNKTSAILTSTTNPSHHPDPVLIRTGALLPSAGIEDQFSKSSYYPTSESTKYGLVEKLQPGSFTPRKQMNNPSGNQVLVKTWGKGVDINQQSIRGSLKSI